MRTEEELVDDDDDIGSNANGGDGGKGFVTVPLLLFAFPTGIRSTAFVFVPVAEERFMVEVVLVVDMCAFPNQCCCDIRIEALFILFSVCVGVYILERDLLV